MSLKAAKERVKNYYQTHFNAWFREAEQMVSTFKNQALHTKTPFWTPVVIVVATISVIVSMGTAVISLITLFCSLLVLYFIMTKVFGFKMEFDDVVRV